VEPEAEDQPPPPIRTLAPDLPIEKLSWPNFERLCLRLAESLGQVEHAEIYGTPGQNQKGIDIYARLGDGDYYVFQCRRTQQLGPASIEKAVTDFLVSDWATTAGTFVLCATVTFRLTQRADQVEQEAARLRKLDKVFLTWGRDHLSEALRARPDLVNRFFGDAWRAAFCVPSAARAVAGPLPRVWELPDPTRTFGYRQAELDLISQAVGRSATTPSIVVLHGLGGTGKTQLAAGWARAHRADFDLGWWVSASLEPTASTAVARLAEPLGVANAGDDEESAVVAVRARLSSAGRWLLILDDLDDPASVFRLVPETGGGTVLITSRRHGGWRATGADPIAVGLWNAADGIAYLLAVSGDNDKEAATEIVARLNCLPLAIAQAAAYVDETGTSLARYQTLLADQPRDLLAVGTPPDYSATVRTTWLVAFAEVEKAGPLPEALLGQISYCGPSRLSRRLLDQLAVCQGASAIQLDEALAQLLRFSLVQPDGDGVSMHALVGLVARDCHGAIQRTNAAMAAANAVLAIMPQHFRDPSEWSCGAELLEAALSIAGEIGALPGTWRTTADLLHRSASYLTALSDLRGAVELFEREDRLLAHTESDDPGLYARFLNDYGVAVRDLGNLTKARQLLTRALELKEAAGVEPLLLASSADNLGRVEQQLGELQVAHTLQQRALDIYAEELGEEHPIYALQLSNLGTVRLDEGDAAGARRDFERALEIIECIPGDHRHQEAMVRGNLGNALQDLGNAGGAVREQERTVRIKRELYGVPHASLADTLGNLGTALLASRDPVAAAATQREALAMFVQLYGPANPGALHAWHNLANALEANGQEEEARAARQRAEGVAEALGMHWPPEWLGRRDE
jgi:tetratricopeptide (TPR) repeat protein